jgi:hypothetical protein
MRIRKLGLVRLLSMEALGLHSSLPKFSFPDKYDCASDWPMAESGAVAVYEKIQRRKSR